MFENIALSIVANVIGDFGKGVIGKFFYRRKKEKLEKLINKKFLEKLGNELYYNDLDGFLVEENFVDKIISYSTGNKVNDVKSIKMYVESLSEKFIQNKSNHWLYKSDIKKTIFILALTIFEVLNEYHNDENARVIITVLGEEFRNGFYEMENKIKAVEDIIEINTAAVKDGLEILYEQDEKSTGIIVDKLNTIQDMLTDDKLGPKNVTMSNIANEFKDSPYFDRINQIENNFQSKHLFAEAIGAYTEIISELVSLNATGNKRLLFTLYLNLALCYLNIGKYKEGIKNLEYAEKQDSENEKLYYVKAVFDTHSPSEKNYNQALENLDIAISKKENYHRAIFLRYYVKVAIDPNAFENVFAESKNYFEKEISKSNDNSLISEYYSSIGLAAKISRNYRYAIEFFEKAEEFEKNIVNKINIAYTYYAWALKDNDRGGYVLHPSIDFEKFDLSYKLCKELLDSDDPVVIVNKETIRDMLISISTFGNIKYNITDLLPKDISSIEDYSVKRAALFSIGAQRELTADEVDLLSDLDKKIYTSHQFERQGKYDEAKTILEELLIEKNAEHFMMIAHNLLVVCINSKDTEKYKEIRQFSAKKSIVTPEIGILDCLYEELIGKDISEIKNRVAIIKNRTTDVISKYQILLFYIRHGFNDEAVELIKEIHKNINERAVNYIDNEKFYKTIINFVMEADIDCAVEICNTLCSDKVSKQLYLEINIVVHNRIQNNKKLKTILYDYYKLTKNTVCLYDASVAALLDFDNTKCEEYSKELLSTSDNLDLKAKAHMMLSNSNFLKGDVAEAFESAKSAHEIVIDIPNHQAHQFFMQRSLMTGNIDNSLAELHHYKENHPIMVDWFETFSIEETDDGAALIDKIKEFTGDSKYQEKQDLLKNALGSVSIYQVAEIFNYRAMDIISKSLSCNSKFMLSTGNIKDVNDEMKNISSKLVIDSYALFILGCFDIVNILDEFDEILLTPQTIESVITGALNSSYENVISVYNYLKKSLKVNVYPCLDSVKKSDDDFCPDEIIACNRLSKREDVSYLYADFRIKSVLSETNMKMISVVTAIAYIAKKKKNLASQCTYKLLNSKNCHFINFDAIDIINVIEKDNMVKKDNLLPFLCLTSDCDVDSFAFVYVDVLKYLISKGDRNKAVDYSTIIFEYCNQIFKRAQTHLYLDKYSEDSRGVTLIRFVKAVIINFQTILTENKYDAEKMILSIKWNANVKPHILSILNDNE